MASSLRPSVLFVCLGNICRSPLAEAAFRRAAERAGLDAEIDSAGTGDWHVGDAPDPRAQAVALRNGVDISRYHARQVSPGDFDRFDPIFALDRDNLAALRALMPVGSRARLKLLLDVLPGREGQAVVDPYYGKDEGFDVTWRDVDDAAQALVACLTVQDAEAG